jgi:hypothetical protein
MSGLKLQTPVDAGHSSFGISLNDKIFVIGSCFADNIGAKMKDLGLDVCVNPFGTLYNPVSICNSIARLSSGVHFSEDECVEMGAGAGLVCSFSHHTTFARKTAAEFLEYANARLDEASAFWKGANKVIVTLGTAWCYEYTETGEIVSNCLKRDAKEFSRRRLSVAETSALLMNMLKRNPEKDFIFTVSPIRHMKDGAHGNQLSKSTLLLSVDNVLTEAGSIAAKADVLSEIASLGNDIADTPSESSEKAIADASSEGNPSSNTNTDALSATQIAKAEYFPAYEIMMDELRDYRFYAEDMVHPSQQAVDYLWSRFTDFAFTSQDIQELSRLEDDLRRSRHRPILHQA